MHHKLYISFKLHTTGGTRRYMYHLNDYDHTNNIMRFTLQLSNWHRSST